VKLLGAIAFELARIAALVGLAAAAAWSFRVAVSDYYASAVTVSGLEQAIAWSPSQSLNYVRLSALITDTDAGKAEKLLQQAVALNPLDSRSWIDLALRHEMNGSLSVAEQELLRAAGTDRQYLPRWSLANFYFRRGDDTRFWLWARSASAMLYGDPRPLFRLCDAVTADANLIERLGLRDPDIRASYLSFVLARNQGELIPPVTQRLLTDNRESDVPILLAACDRLLELQNVGEAIVVWNGLSAARRIPYGRLSPDSAGVTNSAFSSTPTSQGFDWRVPDIGGVNTVREDAAGGIRLIFSGRQPESCAPLSQFIPVRENTHYELEYLYNTSGIADGSGLSWNIEYMDVRQPANTTAEIASDEKGATRVMPFDTPPGCHSARLSLTYRRAPGTTRIEGNIVLRQVRLRPAG
jgi:tetratricopeptide (TPR) repeat protein